MRRFIVAIDGFAASGKGTLAHKLAKHYKGAHLLSTGNLYRYVAQQLLRHGTSFEDNDAIKSIVSKITPTKLNSPTLMEQEISTAASQIAQIKYVRQVLKKFQQEWIKKQKGVAIVEGRDIGTVICPNADVKFFLTASLEARAERRLKDLKALGDKDRYTEVRTTLSKRDKADSTRKIAPLKKAKDAIVIDSTNLKIDQVAAKAITQIDKRVDKYG